MDVFEGLLEALLEALYPFSRNLHTHFQFREFTDFQKRLCECQSKKSYLRGRCDGNQLLGGERVFTAREGLGMSCVCRIVGGRESPQGGVFPFLPLPSHALRFTKIKVDNRGRGIAMLVRVLGLLAMLMVAFGL